MEITLDYICSLFPERKKDSHKGDFGRLLCITGSRRMPGAAIMSALAALRSGVGLLTVGTAKENISAISSQCWEAMYLSLETDNEGFMKWAENMELLTSAAERSDGVLLGCGMGVTDETARLTEDIVRNTDAALILDADGLNIAAERIDIIKERKAPLILTPHPGEMARLLGTGTREIQSDRRGALEALCCMLPGTVVVLKGKGTLIGQDGRVSICIAGNPGMSRGGSGDVLAGMIAAFAVQGLAPYDAACAGVYIHGKAGDAAAVRFSQAAMLPRDIIGSIPEVFLEIEDGRK